MTTILVSLVTAVLVAVPVPPSATAKVNPLVTASYFIVLILLNLENLFPDDQFTLPSGTRHSLSSILIVHPIACFMTLICTGLAFASHFHGPAHSPRYLLALLIFSFPTLLLTLLAFLVDILLFIPHMQWGGWIVLAATIIITASSVLTCAMRRTLVSRKARKKRIEENAEMNGQNYYAMQQESRYARAESPPLPADGSDSNKPAFATYDYDARRPSAEDRIPLNTKAPSIQTTSTPRTGVLRSEPTSEQGTPFLPAAAEGTVGAVVSREVMRDGKISPMEEEQYIDRVPIDRTPSNTNGQSTYVRTSGQPPSVGSATAGYSNLTSYPQIGGFQGRGNLPARGGQPLRGGYRGGPPPPGWNGYGRGRGVFVGPRGDGMTMGRGGNGLPPGNHGQDRGAMRDVYREVPTGLRYNPAAFETGPGKSPSPELEGLPATPDRFLGGPSELDSSDPSYATQDASFSTAADMTGRSANRALQPHTYELSGRGPSHTSNRGLDMERTRTPPTREPFLASEPVELPALGAFDFGMPINRHELPAELGEKSPVLERADPIENDRPQVVVETHRSTTDQHPSASYVDNVITTTTIEPSAIEHTTQQRKPSEPFPIQKIRHSSNAASHRSHGSGSAYAEERTGSPMPRDRASSNPYIRPMQQASPPHRSGLASRTPSDVYIEDVDPRFAPESVPPVPMAPPQYRQPSHQQPDGTDTRPARYVPGVDHHVGTNFHPLQRQQFNSTPPRDLDNSSSVYDGGDTAVSRTRSPAQSETSNFTSVSQRGINPAWRPQAPPSMAGSAYGGSQASARNGRWKSEDTILAANPDFALPGMGMGRGGPGPRGRGRSRGGGGGIGPSMLGEGRYPTGDV